MLLPVEVAERVLDVPAQRWHLHRVAIELHEHAHPILAAALPRSQQRLKQAWFGFGRLVSGKMCGLRGIAGVGPGELELPLLVEKRRDLRIDSRDLFLL